MIVYRTQFWEYSSSV